MKRINFDHNATTPLDPRVRESLIEFLSLRVGNPSSLHREGRAARRILEDAREDLADALGCEAAEIVFTSGATEANHLALNGLLNGEREPHRAIAISAVEHPSVIACAHERERSGTPCRSIAVDSEGIVSGSSLEDALDRGCSLVSIMAANNEIGSLQPIRRLAERCAERGASLHSDGVQILGKLPIELRSWGVQAASFSAHKIGGPAGVGALWVARETPLRAQILGGSQERERRAGTENLLGIVGFASACRLAVSEAEQRRDALRKMEASLLRTLREQGVEFSINGPHSDNRLPGTLNLHFRGVPGESLLLRLDLCGVAVSQGSACSSGSLQPSHVLSAIGVEKAQNLESLRISLSYQQSEHEIIEGARRIAAACKHKI